MKSYSKCNCRATKLTINRKSKTVDFHEAAKTNIYLLFIKKRDVKHI